MNTKEQIKTNIERIVSEIGGRAQLLAATKTVPAEMINYAADCGITLIGENRVNELLEKYDLLDKTRLHIHFIGALQTNKVKYIIDKVEMIHSVDRMSLAQEIDRQAAKHGVKMDVLVEVNIAGEETKSGVKPEEAEDFCRAVAALPNVRLRGLMCVPPKCDDGAKNIGYFCKMSKIFVDISGKKIDNSLVDVLSLGMSGDYLQAVEYGSTMVRIGSAIFGERNYGTTGK
ncbi:MAG: YggS family pyridoxal phosphate-dependent enzyme [Clostridia bacterium]|nr:YggS family pyridoxal phosphate-dependent enzyme [Clostridia bacterium]